jgi:hypothetical protein
MFKAKEKPSKGKGIADLGEEDSVDTGDYEARRQMAMQMLDAAREKHDPANYQTLAENERPMVFRPTAVNLPQPQQPVPVAQQMAQMQAAGIRPVGMAHGGVVRYGYAGNNGSFVTPNGPAGLEGLPEADTLSPAQKDRLAKGVFDTSNFNARVLASGQAPEEKLTNSELFDVEDMRLAERSLSPEERDARAARAKDKYYEDKAEELLKERFGEGRFKPKDVPPEASTAFGRFGAADVAADNERLAAARDKAKADIKKKLMLEDVGSDSFTNAYNIFKTESSAERTARQEEQARKTANIEKYGSPEHSLKTAPEKDALDKRDYNQEREGLASLGRIAEDQASRPVKDTLDKRDYNQEREGLASLGRIAADQASRPVKDALDKRDYAQERAAQAGIDQKIEARLGYAPGAATEAARPGGTIRGVPGAAVANGNAPTPTSGDTNAPAPAGGTATGGAKSNEPAKFAPATTLESIKADRAKEREDNINLALINAGLAMMGGKSSNAFVNIGEGGMQGIRQFSEAQRETNRGYREDVRGYREDERAARALEEQKRQFGITSANEATRIGLEGRRITEAERAALANESLAAELGRGRLGVEQQNAARLDKALNEDIKTTAAKLGISTQELQVQRDRLAQEADQFNASLTNKKDEYKTNIEIARAKQDESMLSDLHKNITADLTAIENNRTRLQGNMVAGMMNPEDYKASMKKFNDQETTLRGQLLALRGSMSNHLKLGLPTPNLSQSDPFGIRSTQ